MSKLILVDGYGMRVRFMIKAEQLSLFGGKAKVKQHVRVTRSGKVAQVKQHQRATKGSKGPAPKSPEHKKLLDTYLPPDGAYREMVEKWINDYSAGDLKIVEELLNHTDYAGEAGVDIRTRKGLDDLARRAGRTPGGGIDAYRAKSEADTAARRAKSEAEGPLSIGNYVIERIPGDDRWGLRSKAGSHYFMKVGPSYRKTLEQEAEKRHARDEKTRMEIERAGPLPDAAAVVKEARTLQGITGLDLEWSGLPGSARVDSWGVSYGTGESSREGVIKRIAKAWKAVEKKRGKYRDRAKKLLSDVRRLESAGQWWASRGSIGDLEAALKWADEPPLAGLEEKAEAVLARTEKRRVDSWRKAEAMAEERVLEAKAQDVKPSSAPPPVGSATKFLGTSDTGHWDYWGNVESGHVYSVPTDPDSGRRSSLLGDIGDWKSLLGHNQTDLSLDGIHWVKDMNKGVASAIGSAVQRVGAHMRAGKSGVSMVKEHQRWRMGKAGGVEQHTREHDHGDYTISKNPGGYSVGYQKKSDGESYGISGEGTAHSKMDPQAGGGQRMLHKTEEQAKAAADKHHQAGAKASLSSGAARRKARVPGWGRGTGLNKAIVVRSLIPRGQPSMEAMNKAVDQVFIDARGDAAQPDEWQVGAYCCEYRPLEKGNIGVLTITAPDMSLPFHVVIPLASHRYKMANEAVRDLMAGRTPARGVYRARVLPNQRAGHGR